MTNPFTRINLTPVEPEELDFDYKFPDEEISEKIAVRCKHCDDECVKSPEGEWVHKLEITVLRTKFFAPGYHRAEPDIIDVEVIDE